MMPHAHAFFARLLVAITLLGATAHTQAEPTVPLPGESNDTLELFPFAKHAGHNAMGLTHANDGTGRVFVNTQSGQVFAYTKDGESLGVFLDLNTTNTGFTYDAKPREPFKGLMSIAFHPDYNKPNTPGQGKLYTAHQITDDGSPGDLNSDQYGGIGERRKTFAIAEWRVDANNPNRIDPASHRRVMRLIFKTVRNNPHAVGQIRFNPYAEPGEADYGKLYIAVGDGDHENYTQTDQLRSLQQLDNPFGKILRIDPLASDGKAYTVPRDNPHTIDGNEDGERSVIFATGLRNPHWFCFAKDLDGEAVILASDIGHLLVEEINIVRPGGNYGWPRYEGTLNFKTELQLIGDARPPVIHYGHAIPPRIGAKPEGGLTAISGGMVVSDPKTPSFEGKILFTDLPRGAVMVANYHHALTGETRGRQSQPKLITLKLGEKTGNFADLLGTDRGDIRLGYDESGSVYFVSKQTNTIYKTQLINTGLPVETDASISRKGTKTDWALLVIVAVTGFLVLELFWVWRNNKSKLQNRHE